MLKKYLLVALLTTSNLAFSQDEFFTPQSTISGYGELHYNLEKIENQASKQILDFHRFVLFFGYSFTEKWSFKSELELEHNFVQDGQGELELEQAFVNYHHADWFGFQVGVVLPSAGLLNEFHEPPLFLGVERPDYHNKIIPTTWFGNGLSLYGVYANFDYKLTVMESMNPDGFSLSSGIRGGREKGYKSEAANPMFNFRVDYLGLPNLKVGASATYNNAKGDSISVPFQLLEFHAKYYDRALYSVFEIGNIAYDKGELQRSFGYYFDLGYNVGTLLGSEMQIIPFVRYTDYNTAAETVSGGITEEQYKFSKWMVGLSLMPIDNIVFKIDYAQRTRGSDDQKVNLFNLGAGYMF